MRVISEWFDSACLVRETDLWLKGEVYVMALVSWCTGVELGPAVQFLRVKVNRAIA